MRATVLAVELAVVAAGLWLVQLVRRPGEFEFDALTFERLQVVTLALATGGVTAVVVLIAAHRRHSRPGVVAIGAIGVAVVLGAGRVEPLSRPAEALTASFALASVAAVLVAVVAGSSWCAGVDRATVRAAAIALVVTGSLAAALGAGAGPTSVTVLPAAGRAALVANLLVLVATTAWVTAVVWRDADTAARRRALRRDPLILTAAAMVAAAAWERIVALLPVSTYRLLARDVYRPWALVFAVDLPVAATLAVVVALGWKFAVRPRVERLAPGVVVVPDDDPLVMLRDDLAAWTGDPTLDLAYADGPGRWVAGTGEVPPDEVGYHRARTVVTQGGQAIGVIDHDLSLAQAPGALRTAAEMAGIAFHANQLLALSEARLAEARQLGRRLLVADVTTREKVMATLEAGPIGRLETCADAVRFGAAVADVVEPLRDTTAEVRVLSHGLYPPELIEGGLAAVLGDRQGTPSRRLPAAVEITAFLLARDDPEAWFECEDEVLWVHRRRPVVDRSIADRVEVLGGTTRGGSVGLPVAEG